ncbi:MAG TPA: sorbosone dehydrogenase family protein [Chryseolinea sp.]
MIKTLPQQLTAGLVIRTLFLICLSIIFQNCKTRGDQPSLPQDSVPLQSIVDSLPPPFETKSVKNYSKVLGWPEGKSPLAPVGFTVTKFADGLQNPRWIYVTPNGDILVAEANTQTKGLKKVTEKISGKAESQNTGESANRITLLRDKDNDGKPELKQVLLFGLNQPLGMLVLGNSLYVANTDGLIQYPYQPGQTQIKSEGKKILDLPAGGYNNHWTRNIIANPAQTKIFISVGSASNIGEHGMENEVRRANILEINPDGSGERVLAGGLRNPVGMGFAPGTNQLWTVVNERDELGDNLVPDYLTHVKDGGFYGWPYAYYGPNEDPRLKGQQPELVKQTIIPDMSMGAHTASLGLAFYSQKAFPPEYHGGVFIGQHGSWNRSNLSGYKVVFVPFRDGKPSGDPQDFLTGFIADESKSEVYGRPVGVAVLPNGALLVADDASNVIWKIQAK